MSSNHCLNCGTPLTGKFCQECGQSATTHRLSLKHFVVHDMVHGIWHLDRGFIYTIGNLFTRPGKFVHEYLAGKRAGHFNALTLLMLLSAIFLYFSGPPITIEEIMEGKPANSSRREISEAILKFFTENYRWITLLFVPAFTFCSLWIFRRRKYLFTEHLILNSYIFAGYLSICVVSAILLNIPGVNIVDEDSWVTIPATIYSLFAYWQVWKRDYSFMGVIWRIALFVALSTFVFSILFLVWAITSIMYLS